ERERFGAKDEVIGPPRGRAQALDPVAAGRLHPTADGGRNGLRDFVLHGEDTAQITIVALRPKVIAGATVDELGGNPQPFAGSTDTAFHDIGNTELARYFLYLDRLVLECEGRVAGNHEERAEARQLGNDVLGDPVAEILLFGVATYVREGQHGDRRLVGERQLPGSQDLTVISYNMEDPNWRRNILE